MLKAAGNGLRADIWEEFKERFNIREVYEVYGSTEGRVGLINNYQKCGCVGRLSPFLVGHSVLAIFADTKLSSITATSEKSIPCEV